MSTLYVNTINPQSGSQITIGDNLSVTGSLTVTGSLLITGSLIVSGSNTITNYGSFISNEAGEDFDFRVESINVANMLLVDGGNDRVGIGTATPQAMFDIHDGEGPILGIQQGMFRVTGSGGISIYVTSSGEVGIGTTTPITALDVHHDPTSLSNDTGGGEVVRFGSGTLTAGKLYYLHTDGAWTETDADAVATGADQLLGIALGSAPGTDGVLLRGFFDADAALDNFSSGKAVHVSTSAAKMDTTAPSATGDFVRIVGYCTDTAKVIYFNPSDTYIELA